MITSSNDEVIGILRFIRVVEKFQQNLQKKLDSTTVQKLERRILILKSWIKNNRYANAKCLKSRYEQALQTHQKAVK